MRREVIPMKYSTRSFACFVTEGDNSTGKRMKMRGRGESSDLQRTKFSPSNMSSGHLDKFSSFCNFRNPLFRFPNEDYDGQSHATLASSTERGTEEDALVHEQKEKRMKKQRQQQS